MGRAERRAEMRARVKQNRKNWKQAFQMVRSPDALRRMTAEVADIQTKKQVRDSILATLLVLHDKFDFGEKRLNRFLEEYNNVVDAVNGRYVSIEEIDSFLRQYKLHIYVDH